MLWRRSRVNTLSNNITSFRRQCAGTGPLACLREAKSPFLVEKRMMRFAHCGYLLYGIRYQKLNKKRSGDFNSNKTPKPRYIGHYPSTLKNEKRTLTSENDAEIDAPSKKYFPIFQKFTKDFNSLKKIRF